MKNWTDQITCLLATGFGLGNLPKIPGTFGSLWGPFSFFLFREQPRLWWLLLLPFVVVVSVVVSQNAEKLWQKKDDQRIVIDEVAGMWVTYAFVPFTPTNLVLGFLLFRIFDMIKIFPARLAQDRLPGGIGVVADDLVAGVQAGVLLVLFQLLF